MIDRLWAANTYTVYIFDGESGEFIFSSDFDNLYKAENFISLHLRTGHAVQVIRNTPEQFTHDKIESDADGFCHFREKECNCGCLPIKKGE
jgi:hypothetical protein